MDYEDYKILRRKVRGPLWESRDGLTGKFAESFAVCDEGKELLRQAQEDLKKVINSTGLFIEYAARMNGFDQH